MKLSKHVVSKKLQNEEVLLELKSGTYFGLNETGTFLFELFKKGITPAEMASALVENFETDIKTAQADVQEFLADLKKNDLICGEQ